MTDHYLGPGTADESAGAHLRNALSLIRLANELAERTGKMDLDKLLRCLESVERRVHRARELVEER